MTLGERCDEIVRIIDETLEDCGLAPETAAETPSVHGTVRALSLEPGAGLARSA